MTLSKKNKLKKRISNRKNINNKGNSYDMTEMNSQYLYPNTQQTHKKITLNFPSFLNI